jgi:predicted small lipoprotein YifL
MRFCWAQYTFWAVIIALGVMSLLAGCGAKGDLYLPPEQTQTQKQEAPAQPAPRTSNDNNNPTQ